MGDRLPLYSNKVSDRRLVRWHKAIHIQTDLDRLNFFLGWGGGVGGGHGLVGLFVPCALRCLIFKAN